MTDDSLNWKRGKNPRRVLGLVRVVARGVPSGIDFR